MAITLNTLDLDQLQHTLKENGYLRVFINGKSIDVKNLNKYLSDLGKLQFYIFITPDKNYICAISSSEELSVIGYIDPIRLYNFIKVDSVQKDHKFLVTSTCPTENQIELSDKISDRQLLKILRQSQLIDNGRYILYWIDNDFCKINLINGKPLYQLQLVKE